MLDAKTLAQQAIERVAARRTQIDLDVDADPVGWIIGRDLESLTYDDYFADDFYAVTRSLPRHPTNPHGFPIPELQARPMDLYPAQAGPLVEALRRDGDQKFIYSTVVWSAIKKSAKSSIAAAVGLWFAWRKPYSRVKVIANDLKQAESRVYYYMRRAVELHPNWKDTVKINRYDMTFPNGSKIEAIPIDPTGEAGGNDDLVIYSEIWGWRTSKALQMWTESTLSPLLYGQSMRWCETYAGGKGQSPVLETLYEAGVTNGQIVHAGREVYANDAARQFTLWMTKPSLPWQTKAYYAQERATLDKAEFDRVHRNQWTTLTGRVYPDFDRVLNVSAEAEYRKVKGDVFWGGDDGFALGKGPGHESYHPRAVVLAQRNSLGGIDVFDEYEQAGVSNHRTTVDDLLARPYPRPEAAAIDSSAQMWIATLWQEYDIYTVGATHEISEGIKLMRQLICNANGTRLLRIHPRCKRLIANLEALRFAEGGSARAGEVRVLKVDDHLPDALRYLAWILSGS